MTKEVAYALSIGPTIDDLGWPSTVVSSNYRKISRNLQTWEATTAK